MLTAGLARIARLGGLHLLAMQSAEVLSHTLVNNVSHIVVKSPHIH